eukprot:3109706-Rhodomonas_salina.1
MSTYHMLAPLAQARTLCTSKPARDVLPRSGSSSERLLSTIWSQLDAEYGERGPNPGMVTGGVII